MEAGLTLIIFVLIILVMAKGFYMYRYYQEESDVDSCNQPQFPKPPRPGEEDTK